MTIAASSSWNAMTDRKRSGSTSRASPHSSPSAPVSSRPSCVSCSSLDRHVPSPADAPRLSAPVAPRARSAAVPSTRPDMYAPAPTGTNAELSSQNEPAGALDLDLAKRQDVEDVGDVFLRRGPAGGCEQPGAARVAHVGRRPNPGDLQADRGGSPT